MSEITESTIVLVLYSVQVLQLFYNNIFNSQSLSSNANMLFKVHIYPNEKRDCFVVHAINFFHISTVATSICTSKVSCFKGQIFMLEKYALIYT